MRRFILASVSVCALAWSSSAWAVVGSTTVTASDGAKPIAGATISVTFKDAAGRALRSPRPQPARTGKRTIKIPPGAVSADISVTADGRTATRTDVAVSLLDDREFVVDLPGPGSPPSPFDPGSPGVPPTDGPGGPMIVFGLGSHSTACNPGNWKTTGFVSFDIPDPVGENPDACMSTALRGSVSIGTSVRMGGSWLVGGEVDIGFANGKSSVTGIPGSVNGVPGVTPAVAANDSVSINKTWDFGLRGRFGYFVAPRTVVYGTAGVAFQHIEATVNCTAAGACGINGIPAFSATNSKLLTGWTAGGGVETSLTQMLVARFEYRYSHYGTYSATLGQPANLSVAADIKQRTHTTLFGIGLKLGR
jgi:outer membrane immunogenic protein